MMAVNNNTVQQSIDDVIRILDSAPILRRLSFMANKPVIPLTNRVPIAHLAIERGLKALIVAAGGTTKVNGKNTHSLSSLYGAFKACEVKSADFLAKAFDDAVRFFGYDANAKRFHHLRSLDRYLSKTGTEKAFNVLRYWAIEPPSNGETPIPYIEPPIHRELLCALSCLCETNRRETVSDRVERKVAKAMLPRKLILVRAGESENTARNPSDIWYENWIFSGHDTWDSVIKEAILKNFDVKENDESVRRRLSEAYQALKESNDPAVRYFIRTLTYLPEGSQKSIPDAIPEIKWSNADKTEHTVGMVVTPADTLLGAIEKIHDEAWEITPYEDGWTEVTDIAESETDAANYLVNRRTMEITVTVHGESRKLRIIDSRNFTLIVKYFDPAPRSENSNRYRMEFWDRNHRLNTGDKASIELTWGIHDEYTDVIEATVTAVADHRVTINIENAVRKTTVAPGN